MFHPLSGAHHYRSRPRGLLLPSGGSMSAPLLQASGLTKAFRHKTGLFARPTTQLAVDSIGFELAIRERLGVVGESGSGKSTLGRLLLGLTEPTRGDVWFEGINHKQRHTRDWKEFRARTSLVQQNPLSALNPQMTIGQQVAEDCWSIILPAGQTLINALPPCSSESACRAR